MAETTTITVRVSLDTKEKLDRLAGMTGRSRSYLVADALGAYVAEEIEIVEGILEGIRDADEGRVFTSEQVKAHIDALFEIHRSDDRTHKKVAAR